MVEEANNDSKMSVNDFLNGFSSSKNNAIALFFWADWAEPSVSMKEVFSDLERKFSSTIDFASRNVDDSVELAEHFEIESIPTFIILEKKTGKVLERLEGANPGDLSALVSRISGQYKESNNSNEVVTPESGDVLSGDMKTRLDGLISTAPVMLFMKGSPEQPRCGFSRQIVALLREHDVSFGYFDILNDQGVREALKKYSDWPTYPQLYVKGELVGGLDIIKEMIASGEFESVIKGASAESLNSRLISLIKKDKLMIFIKGTPDEPRCGFTRQLLSLLSEYSYSYFDILSDEEVRQGLKTYSNWPTFPQVYYDGELIGGLDIVKDMISSGEFQAMIEKQ